MRKNHLAILTVRLPLLAANSLAADFVGSRKSPATVARLVTNCATLCDNAICRLDLLVAAGDRLLQETSVHTLSRLAAAAHLLTKQHDQ